MSTLTNKKISDTYDGLLKLATNEALTETLTNIEDGTGQNAGVQLNNKGNLKSKTLQSKLLTVEDYSGPNAGQDWLTNLTITPIQNYAQIDSDKGIRFSIDGDNKLTIGENGVININAIGVIDSRPLLVCNGSLKVNNSMDYNPSLPAPILTADDAGTISYVEGPNKSQVVMVMKVSENPDVYEHVVIKENVY